eukprot:TRINITY_DN21577_c0_g1_i1.p1 TRINITY_DN21577_c0_g1~~TRINITY_DN21577_c0_g1_i1.p1  ORF type:complete len:250 (-),score=25.30 TRINITY_DN21577_c0_g1_i1:144-893(-)
MAFHGDMEVAERGKYQSLCCGAPSEVDPGIDDQANFPAAGSMAKYSLCSMSTRDEETGLGGGLHSTLSPENQNIRAAAFELYAFTSALFAGSTWNAVLMSRELYSSDPRQDGADGLEAFIYRAVPVSHLILMTTAATFSMFSTLVFSLCSLYVKTGLAYGNVEATDAFVQETAVYRRWGFRAFVLTCFVCPIDLSLNMLFYLLQSGISVQTAVLAAIPGCFVGLASTISVVMIMRSARHRVFADTSKEH